MNDREELLMVLSTNNWFDAGEIIYAYEEGHEYVTTRFTKHCGVGYFINKSNVKKLTKEEYPEYFLWKK